MAFREPNEYLMLGAMAAVVSGVMLPLASASGNQVVSIIALSGLGLSIALMAYGFYRDRRGR